VTAGNTPRSGTHHPDLANAASRGARGSKREVKPTALINNRGRMKNDQ
jgi:hypothetical protein